MLITQFICWRNIFFILFCLVCEYTVMLFFSYGKHFISETSNCLIGALRPWTPHSWKNVPKASTLTISKGVFNFNVLALVVSEILGWSNFTLGGPASPRRPPPRAESLFFCGQSKYYTVYNGIFKFNFLALVVSEIIGGPKFTLVGHAPRGRHLAEKFLYMKRVLGNI